MEKFAIDTESLDKLLSDSKKVRLLDVGRKMDCEASCHKIPGAL